MSQQIQSEPVIRWGQWLPRHSSLPPSTYWMWQVWHVLWRALVTALTVGSVMLIYYGASALTTGRQVDLMTALDRAIPFIPWTWWIYFPLYLAGLLFAVYSLRNVDLLYRSCLTILLVQSFAALGYLLLPSAFPRPIDWEGTGLTAEAIYWFWEIDPPNNTFPSTHCGIATAAALGMWQDRNRWRFVNVLTALGVVITVHTTKQHYLIDAVAGVWLAWVANRLVLRLWPLRSESTSRPSSTSLPASSG